MHLSVWQQAGRCFGLVTLSIVLAGCVAHRSVESKYEEIASELEPGDRVEIKYLRSGQILTATVPIQK